MMSARWMLSFVPLLVGVLAACDSGSESSTALSAEDARTDWPEVIRIGVVPVEGGADTRLRFEELRQYLMEELDARVEVISASSYQGVITAMANGQLDFARFGPKGYVEAAARAGAEAVVAEVNMSGQQGYRSIFVVPKDSSIQSLEDARGASFAFTDPNSTSGFLIPATIIQDRLGEPAESFFGEVAFSGAHGTSVLQVIAGELDIAATNDLDLDRMAQKGTADPDDLRVVYTSELIPGSPFAAHRDISDSLRTAFSDALLRVGEHPELLDRLQLSGYAMTDDEAYDIIRATDRFLDAQQIAQGTGSGDDGP